MYDGLWPNGRRWCFSMMLFAWTTYLLVTVVLVLAIAALWKYISKK